jgi:hypothetical protein
MKGKTLQNVVDGAIATAGEDDVGSLLACLVGLPPGGTGAFGGRGLGLYAAKTERLRDPFDDAWALCGIATGIRVIEKDCAAHGMSPELRPV